MTSYWTWVKNNEAYQQLHQYHLTIMSLYLIIQNVIGAEETGEDKQTQKSVKGLYDSWVKSKGK